MGLFDAIGTGLQVGLTTGNPWAGVAAGGLALLAGEASDKAASDYQAQQQALLQLQGDRQKEAARIQMEENVLRRGIDIESGARARRDFAREAVVGELTRVNVGAQTGFSGSSVATSADVASKSNVASEINLQIIQKFQQDELFDLQQLRIETIAGLRDDEFTAIAAPAPVDKPVPEALKGSSGSSDEGPAGAVVAGQNVLVQNIINEISDANKRRKRKKQDKKDTKERKDLEKEGVVSTTDKNSAAWELARSGPAAKTTKMEKAENKLAKKTQKDKDKQAKKDRKKEKKRAKKSKNKQNTGPR